MRTRVIPAQITTVEDKIVGSFNLMQMIMLMIPIFFITLVYAVFPPSMSFVVYKITLSIIVFVICVALSLRIKGKVVVNWLEILLLYNFRAKYHIYDKNESNSRELYLPTAKKVFAPGKRTLKANKRTHNTKTTNHIKNLVNLEKIIRNQEVDFRYKIGKKGGLHVAFKQSKKKS